LLAYLDVYTRWVGQLGAQKHTNLARKLVRRWIWQVVLNAALIAAVFIVAAFLGQRPPGWVKNLALTGTALRSALWLAATIVSLPLFIATFRKLQALAMLIAETKVSQAAAGERTSAIRSVVTQIIPFTGIALLGLYVLVLSSALLPSWEALLGLLILVAIVTGLFWRSFVRVYSKAQIALKETLAEQPAPRHDETPAPLRSLLRDAHLETISIKAGSNAASKLIRELQLRTRTGGSIVAIERDGVSIINPGPDEELLPGDKVLVLGNRDQLDQAKAVLSGEEPK
jgi:CPA2 family monovalent cation:H+ antiporter-2